MHHAPPSFVEKSSNDLVESSCYPRWSQLKRSGLAHGPIGSAPFAAWRTCRVASEFEDLVLCQLPVSRRSSAMSSLYTSLKSRAYSSSTAWRSASTRFQHM